MRYKVLYIIPTLDHCGAEKQLTLLATHLPRDLFEVRVVTLTRNGWYLSELQNSGLPVQCLNKKSKISFGVYCNLKKIIHSFSPDLVHTWLFAGNSYGRKAAFACNVPVVVCGERCVDLWKTSFHHKIDRLLAKKTDAYIVNSSAIKDFYVKNGLPSDKFFVIPNAMIPPSESPPLTKEQFLKDLGVLTQSPNLAELPEKSKIFQELAITDPSREENRSPWIIGMVSRLWAQKRIEDALWAADQLKFSLLNFYLVIVGDGPEREKLLRYRDDLQLQDRVFFIGERHDVQRLYPCFDLLWNCSSYEGQSNTILEALYHRIPVIASDIPGNRDLIQPGYNGLLISEFDGDQTRRRTAFSRETLRILNEENSQLRKKLGRQAHENILANYSLDRLISKHVALYTALIKEKKGK